MKPESTRPYTPDDRERLYRLFLDIPSLVRGGVIQPHWMADGSSFWYADGAPDLTTIHKVDPVANTRLPLLETARLRQALAKAVGHEPPYRGLPFADFQFVDMESDIRFSLDGKEFVCRLADYSISALPALSPAEKERVTPRLVRKGFEQGSPDIMEILSPDGRWFVTEKDHNIWLRATADGRAEPLTTDGVEDCEWDMEGAQWSPDSLWLAARKVDYHSVLHVPLVHWLKPTEEVEWAHYTKAGGPLPQNELYLVDVMGKRPVRVDIGSEPDQYVIPVGWLPDGSEYLFYLSDRVWKRLDLMAANPHTGAARLVVREAQETFVLGISFAYCKLVELLKDGKRLVWRSERDGWAHLYLYGIDGGLICRLTQGEFVVDRVHAIDEEGGWVYFTAHADPARPYDTHVCRVRLDGQGFQRLTDATGLHTPAFSPSRQYFLDVHSGVDRPPVSELRRADGRLLSVLASANIDAMREVGWVPPEEFVVKAADGETDLHGILLKPCGFDLEKKYPVIDCLYNGPQTTWVPRGFSEIHGTGTQVTQLALPHLGFVVMMVDGRGTPERGKKYQDVVYRNFGRNEIPDHVAALKQAASSRPYMDLSRVGIFGGSWGGYMTIRGMVLAPDVYHVGVATYPVADLYDHNAGAIEPYMGLPVDNRDGYEYGSSLRLVNNIKGRLLLIHGTSDVNATFSATMKMVEAMVRAGKPYNLVVLPEQPHNWDGASGRYMRQAVARYFVEHLKPYGG